MNTNDETIFLCLGSGRRGDLAHAKAFASRDFSLQHLIREDLCNLWQSSLDSCRFVPAEP